MSDVSLLEQYFYICLSYVPYVLFTSFYLPFNLSLFSSNTFTGFFIFAFVSFLFWYTPQHLPLLRRYFFICLSYACVLRSLSKFIVFPSLSFTSLWHTLQQAPRTPILTQAQLFPTSVSFKLSFSVHSIRSGNQGAA